MDFAMRYDRWYRPLATALGLGPGRTLIRVADGVLQVKNGWAFNLDVPLQDITSARLAPRRPLSWGVHVGGDIWVVNGSRHGMVELKLSRPATSKSVTLLSNRWGEVRTLYLSVTEPDAFVAALAEGR
jgi:hypothetical protein